MSQTAEIMPDGWIFLDGQRPGCQRQYRVLIDCDPPRPWGYWDQKLAYFRHRDFALELHRSWNEHCRLGGIVPVRHGFRHPLASGRNTKK
jgi:hypothetical protein